MTGRTPQDTHCRLTLQSDSPATTAAVGAAIGACLDVGETVCLVGDLGAGKTHLAQGIAGGLGVTGAVTSPTFNLVNEYQGRVPFAHFDFYRLEQAAELDDIGYEEYIDGDWVVVIEWADLFAERLPERRLTIRIEIGDGTRRILHLSGPADLIARIADAEASAR